MLAWQTLAMEEVAAADALEQHRRETEQEVNQLEQQLVQFEATVAEATLMEASRVQLDADLEEVQEALQKAKRTYAQEQRLSALRAFQKRERPAPRLACVPDACVHVSVHCGSGPGGSGGRRDVACTVAPPPLAAGSGSASRTS